MTNVTIMPYMYYNYNKNNKWLKWSFRVLKNQSNSFCNTMQSTCICTIVVERLNEYFNVADQRSTIKQSSGTVPTTIFVHEHGYEESAIRTDLSQISVFFLELAKFHSEN